MSEQHRHYHLGCGERLKTCILPLKKQQQIKVSDIQRLLDKHLSKVKSNNRG